MTTSVSINTELDRRTLAGIRLVAVAAVAVGAVATAAAPVPVAPVDLPLKFMPELSDEFAQPVVNTEKWDPDMPDWGRWSWEPANVSVANGALRLQMNYAPHERNGSKLYYVSGAVRSRASPIRYGYLEARIRAADRYPGVSTAFWAFRNTPSVWTEIDVVELTQHWSDPRVAYFNTHVLRLPGLPGNQPLHEKRSSRLPDPPARDYHVYACLWTEREIVWFVDGEPAAKRTNEHWHQPLDVVLSLGLRPPLDLLPDREGFPVAAYVDYVRVWSMSTAPNRERSSR